MDNGGLLIGIIMGIVGYVSFILGRYTGYKESANRKIDRLYDKFSDMSEIYRELWDVYQKKDNK